MRSTGPDHGIFRLGRREQLDQSVESVDEMKRQQQIDDLHVKYKKQHDAETSHQLNFVPAGAQVP